eukprot:gene34424-44469_t
MKRNIKAFVIANIIRSLQLLPSIFITLFCHSHSQNHSVRITIQQNFTLHIAEVEFFLKNKILRRSNFLFTATSYANSILIGNNRESGPPQAANDGKKETFYHNGFDDSQVGYTGRCCPDLKPALIIFSPANVSFDRIVVTNRQDLDSDKNNYFRRLVGATIMIHNSEGKVLYKHKFKTASSSYSFFFIQQRDISFHGNTEPPHVSDQQTTDGGFFYGKMTPSNEWYSRSAHDSRFDLHVWARCDLTNGLLHGHFFLEELLINTSHHSTYPYWWVDDKNISVLINGTLSSSSFGLRGGYYGSGSFTQRVNLVVVDGTVASTIRIEVPDWSPHLDYPTHLCKETNYHGYKNSGDSVFLSKYIRSVVSLLSLDYNSNTDIDAFLVANNFGPPEHCGLLQEQQNATENNSPVSIFLIGDSIDRNMVEDLCRRTAGSQVFESWADLQYNQWHAASICCVTAAFTLGTVHVFGSPPRGPYMDYQEGPLVGTDSRIEHSLKEYALQFGEPDFILFRTDLWDLQAHFKSFSTAPMTKQQIAKIIADYKYDFNVIRRIKPPHSYLGTHTVPKIKLFSENFDTVENILRFLSESENLFLFDFNQLLSGNKGNPTEYLRDKIHPNKEYSASLGYLLVALCKRWKCFT